MVAEVRSAAEFLHELFTGARWESAPYVRQQVVQHDLDNLLRSSSDVSQWHVTAGHGVLSWWRLREVAKLELWLRSVLKCSVVCLGTSKKP
jgi:hypothetical protein